ncbi:histidine kinase [Paenibacillus sp. LjRoot153]|uniref:sensor histidine kinase n=1 Tax=Paenibacillus sp. LjRoot153 TaxID=3342270 RepID=UPI003ECD46FA
MRKLNTIHSKIFLRYSILIAAIIAFFLVFFSLYMSKILKVEATQNMHQISSNISDTLDLEINNMYATALKVEASIPIKEVFFSDSSDPAVLFENRNRLANIILSIMGPLPNFYKLKLHRNDGFSFEYGSQFNTYQEDTLTFNKQSWVIETFKKDGIKSISPPRQDQVDSNITNVISVSMAFAEIYGMKNDNIVTVEQNYNVFEKIIEKAVISPDNQAKLNKTIILLDKSGNLIYPMESQQTTLELIEEYKRIIQEGSSVSGSHTLIYPSTKERSIVTSVQSNFSGWTVLLEEPESSLMEPVTSFNEKVILFGIVFLTITLIMTFFVSRSLSTPIKKINRSVRSLDLNSLMPRPTLELRSNVDELQELYQTFIEMRERMQESLEEAVASRSHEIQSRMLALQAQMNPHFLYNSLSVLSIMCEDNRNEDAIRFLNGLSSILRYISTNSHHPVKLSEEIKHTNDYMLLMKERYREMLEFHIHVPETMMHLEIPKLCIQPLVENAVKYGNQVDPPWVIRITGKLLSENWIITVSDNGGGFSDEQLQQIKQKLASIDDIKGLPELALNGMGLPNLYIRLKLLYEQAMIFDIKSTKNEGTTITIGGSLRHMRNLL